MAAMFFSLSEVMEKLNKTKEQLEDLVRQGRLREFRDGQNLLFKVDEIEAMLAETPPTKPGIQLTESEQPQALPAEPEAEPVELQEELAEIEAEPELELVQELGPELEQEPVLEETAEELSLAPEIEMETEDDFIFTSELTEADTIASSEVIDDLSDTESDLQLTEESADESLEISQESLLNDELEPSLADSDDLLLASADESSINTPDDTSLILSDETSLASSDDTVLSETGDLSSDTEAEPSLAEIEEDINLDTFGSGSGLLDLSLQADDTSLGGILDEIYTAEGDDQAIPAAGSGSELGALPVDTAQMLAEVEQPAISMPLMTNAYAEPEPDLASNTFGIMLILPLLAVIYTAIVVVSAFSGARPAILTSVQKLIWYIAGGAAGASLLLLIVPLMAGGGGAKKVKKAKPKKVKKAKPKKEKKVKPKKEKKVKVKKEKKKKK